MTKTEIRKQIAERKKNFQGLEKLSAEILERFQYLEHFRRAKAIGAYMPLSGEVDVSPLFQRLEKNFYIPAFDEIAGSYRMARLTTELRKGRFGIQEPAVPVFAAADEVDLIIVPGVAFDLAGGRVGRGGGFYDRLLPQYRAMRIGICFDFQCLENVPVDQHDVRIDRLVTESKILNFATNIRQGELS